MHFVYPSQETENCCRQFFFNLCSCECVFQDPKLREVLGFGQGDNVEGKLVTVVHGNDLVNISFLNFQAMQEDTAKVTVATATTIQ